MLRERWAVTVTLLLNLCAACSASDDDAGPSAGSGGGAATGNGVGGDGTETGGNGTETGGSGSATGGDGAGGSAVPDPGEVVTYGSAYEGGEFHLGPVDYEETEWHNACAPLTTYAESIREAQGTALLAGLWNGIPDVASYCDACIFVETAEGKSALLRVVTYGDTTPNSIDVSPEAYAILDSGEYPRLMTFRFAECPDTGSVLYEFQTGSSEWWTSLWVRNARVPLTSVEVQSANHGDFVPLTRGGDGTLTDGAGFGVGPFSIRLTGVDGQVLTHSFEWPGEGIAGQLLTGESNFE